MATSQNGTTLCPACKGNSLVFNPSMRQMQVCPLCGGEGVKQPQPLRVPYDLVFPNAVLTASQVGLGVSQQLDQDFDLEVVWIVASNTGLYSILMNDPSTGRNFSNAAVNGENFAGTAQLAFPLVEPYVFARSTTVKLTLNDRSGAGNTVQVTLRGFKLIPRNAQQQGSQGVILNA